MQTFLWIATALCNAVLFGVLLHVRPRKLKAVWLFVGYSLALDIVCAVAMPLLPHDRYNILWQFTDVMSVSLEAAAITALLWKHNSEPAMFAALLLGVHLLLRFQEYSWWDNFVGRDLLNMSLNIAGRRAFEARQWAKIPASFALAYFILTLRNRATENNMEHYSEDDCEHKPKPKPKPHTTDAPLDPAPDPPPVGNGGH